MKIIFFYFGLLLISCGSSRTINEKPINFDQDREELTLKYLQERYGLEQNQPTIDPKMIVLHWTAIPTFDKSFNAFYNNTLPQSREAISSAGSLNVSSHFLVDRDGSIFRLMPENIMARHVIGLNHVAIGIENVGGLPDLPLTKQQIKANIWLVNYLANKYEIDYLIGHHEYTRFENHPFWLEKDPGYRTEKTDPGDDFMKKVRQATTQFNFKEIPEKKS